MDKFKICRNLFCREQSIKSAIAEAERLGIIDVGVSGYVENEDEALDLAEIIINSTRELDEQIDLKKIVKEIEADLATTL